MFVIGRASELLSWFHKRIFAELFVGKMLVREHGDEIERFRSGIAESVRHTCRNTRHIRPSHRKTPIADHVLNLAVQNDVRFLTVAQCKGGPPPGWVSVRINESPSKS